MLYLAAVQIWESKMPSYRFRYVKGSSAPYAVVEVAEGLDPLPLICDEIRKLGGEGHVWGSITACENGLNFRKVLEVGHGEQ